jgi:hypothetical protein
MPEKAPLKLTLYDPETGEVVKELSSAIIPTGIFGEMAMMIKSIDLDHPESLEPEVVESLYILVCGLFRDQISVDQIKTGTDLAEFMALVANIMARVGAVMPAGNQANPTPPGPSPRKRRQTSSKR